MRYTFLIMSEIYDCLSCVIYISIWERGLEMWSIIAARIKLRTDLKYRIHKNLAYTILNTFYDPLKRKSTKSPKKDFSKSIRFDAR